MKKNLLIASLFFCLIPFASKAASQSSGASFFNPDVFSLAKKKESSFDSSAAVYVLSSEDIRRSGVTSIPEALRLVPGVQVARISGNAWAISSRGANHQYASKLLVLVDGLTIYTPIFSGTFWDNQDYIIEDIDRIEVIRGPGGSIWGANAMNGIINIITKNSAQTQGGYISQTFGNNDKSITEARYGGKTASLDTYRVYAKHAVRGPSTKMNNGRSNADGSFNDKGNGSNNDGIVSSRTGFKYDLSSIKDNALTISSDFFDTKSNNYFQTPLFGGANGDKENTGGNIVLNWNKEISKKSNILVQSYLYYTRNNIQVVDYRERIADVDFQHFYNFSKENQFIWGLGYKNVQDSIGTKSVDAGAGSFIPLSYSPSTRNVEIYSAFIQDKIGLIADELYLTLGSKFEHNDQTGFEYQPNARLAYYPTRNQTIWGAVSRAIRTPTRGEDGIDIKVDPNTTVTRGAPTSVAETVTSYELGYRVKPTYRTSIDISTFYNQYSNLGTFDADTTNGLPGIPTASNSGYAKTYGLEFTGKWQATSSWRLEVGYDFLKQDVRVNAASNENDPVASALNVDKLVYFQKASPRNQFKIRSFFNLSPKVELDSVVYYVDSLPSRDNVEAGTPSYIRWDGRVGYLPIKNVDLSFAIQNILDDRHTEFSPGLFNNRIEVGRTFYAKVAVQF